MNSYFIDSDVFIIPESGHLENPCNEKASLLVICGMEDYQAHASLLENILKAISYSDGEKACILRHDESNDLRLADIITPGIEKVMCFGMKPKDISMNAGFHANRFYKTESFSILLSHSLEQLNANVKFKKALWAALQENFNSESDS